MRSDNPRVAVGNNSRNTSEDLDDESEIKKLPSNTVLNQTLVRLASLEGQKKDISDQIRQLSKDFVANGGTKAGLGTIRRLQKMDPDDRADFLHEVDAYATFFQFW